MTVVDTEPSAAYHADPMEEYLETRDIQPATRNEYRWSLRRLSEWCDPSTLTHEQALRWRKEMADDGVRPSTVAKHVRHASMYFAWLHRTGRHPGPNPFDGIRKTVQPTDMTRYVPFEELLVILEQCPSASWRNAFALARLAGLRINEIRALKAQHVDMDRGLILVRPDRVGTKKSTRDVPLDPRLRDLLVYREWADPCSGLPRDIYRSASGASARSILESSGIEPYRKPFHGLRASCERDWMDEHPIMTVCYWMGHSPAVAAKHYVRPTPAAYAKATGQAKES